MIRAARSYSGRREARLTVPWDYWAGEKCKTSKGDIDCQRRHRRLSIQPLLQSSRVDNNINWYRSTGDVRQQRSSECSASFHASLCHYHSSLNTSTSTGVIPVLDVVVGDHRDFKNLNRIAAIGWSERWSTQPVAWSSPVKLLCAQLEREPSPIAAMITDSRTGQARESRQLVFQWTEFTPAISTAHPADIWAASIAAFRAARSQISIDKPVKISPGTAK